MFFNPYTLFLLISSTSICWGGTLVNRNDQPLSSKVIFQSPMMENVYKEFILSSKPINLKKYATAKPKNTQKDSNIYIIPIGPMPYNIIHRPTYDYQPVKMNPILNMNNKQPAPIPTNTIFNGPSVPPNFLQAFLQSFQQNPQNFLQKLPQPNQPSVPVNFQPNFTPNFIPNVVSNRPQIVPQNVPQKTVVGAAPSLTAPAVPVQVAGLPDTQMTRLNGHLYYFNGRPYNLKAYRASPKLNVDKHNLNSHLFFNKNIIY